MKWEDIISRPQLIPLGKKSRDRLLVETRESLDALESNQIGYFTDRFSQSEHWRILSRYFPRASFLDVETTGLSRYSAKITTAACYHLGEMHVFVQHENLNELLVLLEEVELLITFNGKSFDIHFVLDAFNIPSLPCPHIDLRWVCYHAGLKKGLKDIESRCGIKRPAELQGLDGCEAVVLWDDWIKRKKVESREKLVRYCKADVIALLYVAGEVLVQKKIPVDIPDVTCLYQKLL
ncbi:MAG TPA: hypothetical protein DCP92_20685 [Nitrospiraceae bacterium]|jgi:uncharacterized protein YprB with RNaseH-like and TPR domain|nr:hypothetical protein [Nitrospiraceae bacterium]